MKRLKELFKKKKILLLILIILIVLVAFLVIKNQSSRYSSAEDLIEEFIDALNNDDMESFIEKSLDSKIYLTYSIYKSGDIFPFYDDETDKQIIFESFYNDICLILEENYGELVKKYSEYDYSEEDFEKGYEEACEMLERLESSEKSDEEELYEYLEKYHELFDVKLEVEDIEFVEDNGIYEKYSYTLYASGTYNSIEFEDKYKFTTNLLQVNGNYYKLMVDDLIELLNLIAESLSESSEEEEYTINGLTQEEWEENKESTDERIYSKVMELFEAGLTEDIEVDWETIFNDSNQEEGLTEEEENEVDDEDKLSSDEVVNQVTQADENGEYTYYVDEDGTVTNIKIYNIILDAY